MVPQYLWGLLFSAYSVFWKIAPHSCRILSLNWCCSFPLVCYSAVSGWQLLGVVFMGSLLYLLHCKPGSLVWCNVIWDRSWLSSEVRKVKPIFGICVCYCENKPLALSAWKEPSISPLPPSVVRWSPWEMVVYKMLGDCLYCWQVVHRWWQKWIRFGKWESTVVPMCVLHLCHHGHFVPVPMILVLGWPMKQADWCSPVRSFGPFYI